MKNIENKSVQKPVICIETGEIFESVSAAARAVNRHKSSMSHHLSGRQKSCAGLHFKFYDKDFESFLGLIDNPEEATEHVWQAAQAEIEIYRKQKEEELRKFTFEQLKAKFLAEEKAKIDKAFEKAIKDFNWENIEFEPKED